MDIIIVGCGKAGSLHRNAYTELKRDEIFQGKLFYVDKNQKPSWGNYNGDASRAYCTEEIIYSDIYELTKNESIDINNTIVDICLPVGTMLTCLEQYKRCGFTNFIIEKPFVFYKEKSINPEEVFSDLNIITVENYLYSKPTIAAQEFIKKYKLDNGTVIADFSKNRKVDSSCFRGFKTCQSVLTIWEIEIPHLIYICNNLFGRIDKIISKQSYDMEIGDVILKDHGKGTLVCTNEKDIVYVIKSNLEYNKLNRTIDVIFDDNYVMHIFYSPLGNEEHQYKCGVILTRKDEIIDSRTFEFDNNMYEMLKDYYNTFCSNRTDSFKSISSMLDFSNFMEKLVEA